jgi:hypothetical protein
MDKVQKYNSFNINTPSSESYRNYFPQRVAITALKKSCIIANQDYTVCQLTVITEVMKLKHSVLTIDRSYVIGILTKTAVCP